MRFEKRKKILEKGVATTPNAIERGEGYIKILEARPCKPRVTKEIEKQKQIIEAYKKDSERWKNELKQMREKTKCEKCGTTHNLLWTTEDVWLEPDEVQKYSCLCKKCYKTLSDEGKDIDILAGMWG